MYDFKKIFLWKKAFELNRKIYSLASKFPEDEKFSLTSQLKRASVSTSSNIAEGSGRKTQRKFVQFLYYSFGSIKEVENQIMLAREQNYINENDFSKISSDIKFISILSRKFIESIEKNLKNKTSKS